MDPISIGIQAVGLGISLFGMDKKQQANDALVKANQQIAAASGDIAKQEQSINDLKQQQMNMQGYRSQIENVRNMQRARALATNSAVNQGAQQGTGLFGGLAQITDQSFTNQVGQNQALQTGNQTAGFNKNISNDKILISQYQAQAASAQGQMASADALTSLGGSALKLGPTIGNMFGGGLKLGGFNSLFGGGSPSGYGA